MADTKRFGALLVAAAVCAGLSAAYAEGKGGTVSITGEMEITAASRKGTTSFTSGQNRVAALAPADASRATNSPEVRNNDETSLTQTKVYLNFGFDLTQNARVFVQLGGRGLAGNNVAANTTNTQTNAGGSQSGDSSFETRVRQAYVELHEVLVHELGLRFGIQDMVMGLDRGDGNHFVMDSRGWGKHFQFRDGGRLENSYSTRRRQGQTPAAATAASFDDVQVNDGGTFAWVATWDQKDMFSANLFWVTLENTGNGVQNGSYIVGVDLKAPLKMVNDKSVVTAHLFNVKDDSFVQLPLTQGAAGTKIGSGANFWQYGLGADMFVTSAFEAYGEFALQHGKFADNWDGVQPSVGVDIGQEKEQDAYAYYVGGKFMVPGAASFKPSVDVSYWSFSGDDDQNDNKNSGFINYGDNKSSMVLEENEYGIGLSNNYNALRIKGTLDLVGTGMTRGHSTPVSISYHNFMVNASRIRGTFANTGDVAVGSNRNADLNADGLGEEWDFSIAHEYSENVTFKLGYGMFRPGMYIRENANLSVSDVTGGAGPNSAVPVLGTPGLSGDGAMATVLTFTTSVKF